MPGKPVELELIGNNPLRFGMAETICEYLRGYSGVTEVWTSYKPGKETIELVLDHDVMTARELTTSDVTQAVRIAFDGLVVDELQTVEERIRYRLQFKPVNRGKLETLKNLVVFEPFGDSHSIKKVFQRSKFIPVRHRSSTIWAAGP